MRYEIILIDGKECLIEAAEESGDLPNMSALSLKERPSLLYLPRGDDAPQKILRLITSLFAYYSENDWDSNICHYHRAAIGLLDPTMAHYTVRQFQEHVVRVMNHAIEHQQLIHFEDFPPLFIILYYGENYDKAIYSDATRLEDAESSPRGFYSRSVYQTTGIRIGDRAYTTEELAQLDQAAANQTKWFQYLDAQVFDPPVRGYWGSATSNKYASLGAMHYQRNVNAYTKFLEEAEEVYSWSLANIQGLRDVPQTKRYDWLMQNFAQVTQAINKKYPYPDLFQIDAYGSYKYNMYIGFESPGDPVIPTTSRREVAIKYAMNDGIVAWEQPRSSADTQGPWAKVYIFAFELPEYLALLRDKSIVSTFQQSIYGQAHLNQLRRLSEDEYSIRTEVAKQNILGKVIIRTGDTAIGIARKLVERVDAGMKAKEGLSVYLLPDGKLALDAPGEAATANTTPIGPLCEDIHRLSSSPPNSPAKIALHRKQGHLLTESQRSGSNPRPALLFSPSLVRDFQRARVIEESFEELEPLFPEDGAASSSGARNSDLEEEYPLLVRPSRDGFLSGVSSSTQAEVVSAASPAPPS